MNDKYWFNSEIEVCHAFLKNYNENEADEEHYQQASFYLDKVGDNGINPLRWYHWLSLSVLVLIEAAGFAYVLAGFTLQDASEALQKEAAVAIALIISALLVVLTHAMGGEVYRNQQIDKVRLRWQNSEDRTNIIEPDSTVSLKSKRNHIDDSAPGWQKMANRLNKVNAQFSKSWVITIATVSFITIVAVGATYVRGQVLEKLAIEQVQGAGTSSETAVFVNPFSDMPQEGVAANLEANQLAEEEKSNAHKKAGWTTFIILAVIFIAMQFYSIYLGFKTTFSGKESKDAYRFINDFDNVTSFMNYYGARQEAVARIAQRVLSHLQAKVANYAQKNSGEQAVLSAATNSTNRNFMTFLQLEEKKRIATEESSKLPVQTKTSIFSAEKAIVALDKSEDVTDISGDVVNRVKNGDIEGMDDATVLAAIRELNSRQTEETPAQRMARLRASLEN
ncbi:hypothetical protein BCT30_05830 [Enterovibrio norvegicus]|nr:hypothetical protein BCU47_16705 [Enterovibrio norvegicus]PMI35664.1 hypothetical protein BCU46_17815 [Enterovibrio norvegicus]PMN43848.1 hypothetical protein BCT30_05830 [Enterovibrio norvegicus]TKF03971.1 hypothetical protein FCV66_24195 [Enterovibrio norvegicus]TKF26284.1 hypothetical protein FCV83_24270 [Enterovibrio norvegicus]